MIDIDPKRIEQYLKNATVKIFVNNTFKGTGFFITSEGHLLTAYHCVAQATQITIKTPFDGEFSAHLQPEKSLSADQYDLAILKTTHRPSHYVPLGFIAQDNMSDNVVAIGYPASNYEHNEQVGVYKGHLSRWRDDNLVELSESIKGPGQSGGVIYHHRTQRVIGVVTERYKEKVMGDAGLASRLEPLFQKWPTLHELNAETSQRWDDLLKRTATASVKHLIIFAILPDDEAYTPLQEALRDVVEGRWHCQLLTADDRQYSPNRLDNIRAHLEQAHAFLVEVSTANPEVMFIWGATHFYLSHRPTVLLAQPNYNLPPSLQGRHVTPYHQPTTSLADDLHHHLSKIEALQQLLEDPEREHYYAVKTLQSLTNLPFSPAQWAALQQRYPTREAWQTAELSTLKTLLGQDSDLAPALLNRISEKSR